MRILNSIFSLVCAALLFSCSSDEPNSPNNEGTHYPEPDNTITVSLYKNGTDNIDGLKIGTNDHFVISNPPEWIICLLGEVKGLGNISSIPLSNWGHSHKVLLNNGYIAYNRYTETFYRMFVSNVSYDELGTITGYQVKYTKPFYGSDESLVLSKQSLSLDWEGRTEFVEISNSSLIPFNIVSAPEWCHIEYSSNPFNADESEIPYGLFVNVNENKSSSSRTGEIIISTFFDKKVSVLISQKGRDLPATTTIANLKEKYWTTSVNSATKLESTSDIVVRGTVISSDESGNIYKTLVINDGTGAISFSLNAYNIYSHYNVGDNISVILNDMYIGMYQGLLQIGDCAYYQDYTSIQFLPYEKFRDATLYNSSNNEVKPIDSSIATLNRSIESQADKRYWQSQLITIRDVMFVEKNMPLANYHESTDRLIADDADNRLVVRTSGYCNFYNDRTPSGKVDISGILSFYKDHWQLILIDRNGITTH